MHYRHRRNDFYLHLMYRRHSLESPCSYFQITGSYTLANISVHLKHNGSQGILLHLHAIKSIMTSGESILTITIIHLLSSIHVPLGCGCYFWFKTSFSYTVLIISPYSMKHKGAFTTRWKLTRRNTSLFLTLNNWFLKSFTSQKAVYEAIR